MFDITFSYPFKDSHKKLSRFSKYANIFSWIVLIYYFFLVLSYSRYGYLVIQQKNLIGGLFKESGIINWEGVIYLTNFVLNIFLYLIKGILYALILRGISIGLNMLMEIDLNYIQKSQGEFHE